VSVTSTNGNVDLTSVSGTAGVSVAGHDGVNVDTLNVGTTLDLAGPTVTANVFGAGGPVTGSVTGYGGGVASNVDLTLSNPGGFAFSDFWAAAARVNVPIGSLGADSTIILDRATFTNPLTTLLVDQHDKSNQGADVQLYTGGGGFSFDMYGNRVDTNAFVLYRDPYHQVVTPTGENTSATESAANLQAIADSRPPAGESGEDDKSIRELVVATTIPAVSVDCERDDSGDCAK
jgi:hypothetical protein